MAQRISRAKQRIKAAGMPFSAAARGRARPSGCDAVLHVLYLIFNEGYTATSGPDLHRAELTARGDPARPACCTRCCPTTARSPGLLALMLLTDARRPARTGAGGELVPLAEQDRSRWDARRDRGGRRAGHRRAGARRRSGPYQLQAAIAAVHDEAAARRGHRLAADPRAVPRCWSGIAPQPDGDAQPRGRRRDGATVRGAGLALLRTLDGDDRMAGHHRLDAVRAHLLELAGDSRPRRRLPQAARRTTSLPERRYLEGRAARLAEHDDAARRPRR